MVLRVFDRRKLAAAATMCLVIAVSGCQSGDTLGALNVGNLGVGRQEAPDDRITVDELMAYCPTVAIPQEGAIYNSYQRGGQDDPTKLMYRASIVDATRSCTYNPGGTMGMTIAVAGRVIPGPAATPGTVRVPLRITVYRGSEQIYSQLHQQDVAIAAGAGAVQFVLNDAGVSMPTPTAGNIRVVAAYDQGPPPRR